MNDLNSVVLSKKADGSWQAQHVPSGKYAFGASPDEAQDEMKSLLGMNDAGEFDEPKTSQKFEGVTREIAEFLEGPVSAMLASHSGFARLIQYDQVEKVASIRLGGGCQGCPSSTMTLVGGVLLQLQEEFGEDVVADVTPIP